MYIAPECKNQSNARSVVHGKERVSQWGMGR